MEFSKLTSEFGLRKDGKSGLRKRTGRMARVASVAVLFAGVLAGCRMDMHIQPKYVPEEPTNFFHDGRSERPVVPGTIARGHLRLDELLYTGKENGVASNRFPFPITRADLERGRERFNIYCTPCHDYAGNGDGMVVQRGLSHPPSYNVDRLRNEPVGHFVDVMTNGFGAMYSYASRVSSADRWRIAAYIRALQLSQHAPIQDVPADKRQKLAGGRPTAAGNQAAAGNPESKGTGQPNQ